MSRNNNRGIQCNYGFYLHIFRTDTMETGGLENGPLETKVPVRPFHTKGVGGFAAEDG